MLRQDKRGREGGVRARHTRRSAHPERWQAEEEVLDPVNYPNRLKPCSANPDCLAATSILSSDRLPRDLACIGLSKQLQCDGLLEHDVSGLIYPRQIAQ